MALNRSPKMLEVSIKYARGLRRKQTRSETVLWNELRGRKLGGCKFKRQWPILIDLQGVGTFAVADFYCAAAKLVIEVDGDVHKLQGMRDNARDEALAKRGYSVMRIDVSDIENHLQQVLARIAAEVCLRAHR